MSEPNKRILLVEDEHSLGYLLSEYLAMKGFAVQWSKNGNEALDKLERKDFDLAILDIMMPEMDGFTLAENIKKKYPDLPFLFLTAKSLKVDVLKGFSLGAVDYLKKPIDEEELVVRINAILSRISPIKKVETHEKQSIGKYIFDAPNQKLFFGKEEINLTTRESQVLQLLYANKNNLTTHRQILTQLWGENDYFNKKSLNVFITRLRAYLKKDSKVVIENVHGRGFILKAEESD